MGGDEAVKSIDPNNCIGKAGVPVSASKPEGWVDTVKSIDVINGFVRDLDPDLAFKAGLENKTVISMDPNHCSNHIDSDRSQAPAFIDAGQIETLNSTDLDFVIGLDSPGDTCRTDVTDYSHSNFGEFISSDVAPQKKVGPGP